MTPLAHALTCLLIRTLRVRSVLILRLPAMPRTVAILARIAFGVTAMGGTLPPVALSPPRSE